MTKRTEVKVDEGHADDGSCSAWCDYYTDTLYAVEFCITEDDPFCTLVEEQTSLGEKCLASEHGFRLIQGEE